MKFRKSKNESKEIKNLTENDSAKTEKSKGKGFSFSSAIDSLRTSTGVLLFTIIGTFVIMIVTCLAIFFSTVQGAEKVMVPDVIGKNLTAALIELRQKELYPEIQLRYSENENDINTILEQNPQPGAITKAYRRITLTVSRGMSLDSIGNYVGKTYSEIQQKFATLYAGETPLVNVAPAVVMNNDAPEGTILAQYPYEGTEIIDPIELKLIVSSGNKTELIAMPDIKNMKLNQFMDLLKTSNIIFDFTSKTSTEKESYIDFQEIEPGVMVEPFTRVRAGIVLAHRSSENEPVSGLFTYTLPDYPFPVSVQLEAQSPDGKVSTLADFFHPGKSFTLPYSVEKDTSLKFIVNGEILEELIVR